MLELLKSWQCSFVDCKSQKKQSPWEAFFTQFAMNMERKENAESPIRVKSIFFNTFTADDLTTGSNHWSKEAPFGQERSH